MIIRFEQPRDYHLYAGEDETGDQSQRYQSCHCIRTVDEVAHADGDAYQDLRRDETL